MIQKDQLEETIIKPAEIQLQRPIQLQFQANDRRKYGNMLVFFQSPCLFSLGPDYWCFLPTFSIFCFVSYLMINFVINNSTNIYFRIATIVICGGTCLSYFLVATSNPGVIVQQDYTDSEQEQNPMNSQNVSRKKLCKKCNIRVKRSARHCNDCDVCIVDYDHHCPWTSKCIGGGNLKRFYLFVGMVPVYLVYVFIAFSILMSEVALRNSTVHINSQKTF